MAGGERESGREGAGGGEERGRKERGGRKGGLSFQIHALGALEGQPGVWGPGQTWLWGWWAQACETAGLPSWPGQDGHRQKPRSMHTNRQREACGRPKHTPAPHHTTGFCPCRARGTGGAHSRATTAAQPPGKPWKSRRAPSCCPGHQSGHFTLCREAEKGQGAARVW